MFSVFQAVIIF